MTEVRVNQTVTGKAFEYACIQAIVALVSDKRPVQVVHNSSLIVASGAWASLDASLQDTMNKSARAGIISLLSLEPKILENEGDELELLLQEDKRGQLGDVRDVLLLRRGIDWEIGISVKHNHAAVKHSRLSQTIDFGKDWVGIANSQTYFDAIKPIFSRLETLRSQDVKWSDVADKNETVYIPILIAFKDELTRLDRDNLGVVPDRLLRYLLGRNDFYKLISDDSTQTTTLQCININGTLNTPSKTRQPDFRVRGVSLPNKIYHFDYKENDSGVISTTTLQLVLNNDWALTFRIHSASTYVEPSLKFDIQLTGVPSSLFTNTTNW